MKAHAPYRKVRLGPSDVLVDQRPDGCILMRSPHALGRYPERMTEPFDYWARHASYRTFLAQREPKWGWRNVTYAEAQFFARRIGQALLNRGLSVENPVVILSGNEIEHALLGIGCMYAGIPYAPIATAYSLASTDFSELRQIFDLLTPGLIYVSDGAKYERAIRAALPAYAELVVNINSIPGATPFADLVNTDPNDSLNAAYAQVTADTVFKILFTSGSTGTPKGVINTHRMWASNQEMVQAYFAFLSDEPPLIVDWLPWSHTLGGNADVGLVLYNGGSLYIDRGRPEPGLFEETIHTLRMIAPTMYGNVPHGFEALLPYLRDDAPLRKRFFSRLKLLYCAGAGLSQQVWSDLAEIAMQECGERILFLTGLTSTEAAPHALFGLPDPDRPGLLSGPAPGIELKLVPTTADKLEARLRGPNITPGYWRRLALTRAAFDEEGFYKTGDCLRFADEKDPKNGFVFDGRIGEEAPQKIESN
jgi:feruloyl-CoA synthase